MRGSRASSPISPCGKTTWCFRSRRSRDGTFIFRVSLADVWRLIAIPATATLDDLVLWILRSVKFDDEHLYQLTYRSRMGSTVSVRHPACEESPYTDEVIIGELPLEPGQTMELLYDFGDEWHFTVKLERIEPPGDKVEPPASWKAMVRHRSSMRTGTSELRLGIPRQADWWQTDMPCFGVHPDGNESGGWSGGASFLPATTGPRSTRGCGWRDSMSRPFDGPFGDELWDESDPTDSVEAADRAG